MLQGPRVKGCEVIPKGGREEQERALRRILMTLFPLLLCWDTIPFFFHECGVKTFPRTKGVESTQNPVPASTICHHTGPVVSSLTSATRSFSSCESRWQGSSVLLVRWHILVGHLQGVPRGIGKPRPGEGRGRR